MNEELSTRSTGLAPPERNDVATVKKVTPSLVNHIPTLNLKIAVESRKPVEE